MTNRNTGEETGLGQTEEDTRSEKSVVVLNDAHQGHDDAPGHHDGRQPPAGAELLEEQVAGDLEGSVGEEEDGQAPVVLGARHVQVLLETLDFGVANVSTLQAVSVVDREWNGLD